MNYKIIAMDFDGTLLTSDKKVTNLTKQTLLKYKNNGFTIIGVTARNFASASNVCDINIFNYLILNNGSFIYDVEKNKEISINSIDMNTIINITNYFDNIAKQIDYCSMNKYYIYKNIIRHSEDKNYYININSIDEIDEKIGKMNIIIKDSEDINKYKNYIEKNFKDVNALIMSDTDIENNREWLTLNPKGINKFETLKRICLELKMSIDDVIFLGDGANDLSIINQVGLGVAMKNDMQEVKEKADEITLSNDEDGIVYFLNKKIR